MTYPVAEDFRSATLAEYCQGLALSSADATDAILTSIITRTIDRIEILTDDQFISSSNTYNLRGEGTRQLTLPLRCTAVSAVSTRDFLGNLTTQSATAYRLVSSLDAAGATAIRSPGEGYDYLEIVPYQYLVGLVGQAWWLWPIGPQAVQVVGTFGWTVTPPAINRAIALMVYDEVKPLSPGLRRATVLSTADATTQYGFTDDAHPTGINDVDEIIRDYRRPTGLLVG